MQWNITEEWYKFPEEKNKYYGKGWHMRKYDKQLFWDTVQEYIAYRDAPATFGPKTKLDFCKFAWLNKDYINQKMRIKDGWPDDFSEAINVLNTECERFLEYYGLLWRTNPAVTIMALKHNYGWKDWNERQQTDTPVVISFKE